MRKPILMAAIGLVLSLGVWFSVAAGASAPRSPAPPVRGDVRVAKVTRAQAPSVAGSAQGTGSRSQGSTGVRGSGTNGSDSGTETENGSENGSGSESESGGGTESDTHEDPDGQDVNLECPPSCDTASGEQP